MAAPLITLQAIRLTFGGTPLLTAADLNVVPGDRIALVGRNGSGKSTLLKIAAGLVRADQGERVVHPGAVVRYLAQEVGFSGYETTLDFVEAGLKPTDDPYAESGSPPDPAVMAKMEEYVAPMMADGTMIGGAGLKASAKGTRVRRMAKQRFVVDGPFTEAKELVGGFMLLQARTLDEAVDRVRPRLRIHREGRDVPFSAIEVRRLL